MDRNKKNNNAGSRRALLVCCFVLASTQAFAAGVEVDGASGTSLDTAPNGVPVVNIARPNERGLSHNTYRQFNVDPSGLILNNATQSVVSTHLGGQILGNSSLGAPARLILNEVTSTSRSYLNGYTEVAGQAADVVIANPNGISVDGAGFINVPRVTLTTGLPQIDALGNLGGFDVRGGDISIDGDGLNTSLQDATSIYTHFLRLNAKLHAQDLDVALGVNQVDYPGRKVVSSGKGSVKRVLLDSSALGGMYANKIVLVGTDQGLGMKLPPEVIASSGEIRISSDGRLVLQKMDAQGDIRLVTNQDIESTETVYSAGAIDIDAGDDLDVKSGMIAAAEQVSIDTNRVTNDGVLVAGLDADGMLNSQGRLEIRAAEVFNRNEIIGTDTLDVESGSLLNQGLFNAYHNLQISADSLRNEATLFSGGDAQLFVQTSLTNAVDASIFAVDDLLLAADAQGGRSTQISNDLGLIQSLQGDIDIHAQRFENLGRGDLQYEMIYYDLGNGREVNTPRAAMTIDLAYSSGYTKHRSKARERWVREVLNRLSRQAPLLYQDNANNISRNRSARFLAIETRLVDYSITTPAYLDSGNDLNLYVDEFINHNSVTSAARDINFSISGDYRNEAFSATERVTDYQYSVRAKHSDNWKNDDKYSSEGRSFYIPVARSKTVSTDTVTQAGRNIAGDIAGQAVNSGVLIGQHQLSSGIDPANYSGSDITLPSNDFGLFVRSTSPESRFLVETNPRFTDFGNFINSRYLLDRLDFSAHATLKRIGDAFYESRLIRDSVFAQTGRRFLDPSIQSDNQQFKYLMDNALIAQGELQLAPGVALKDDQINRLTRDIVWLEAQQIDGETVLVPAVYLANSRKREVRGGRIIAGEDSRMVVASLVNGGLIAAGRNLALQSGDEVRNRGAIAAAGELSLDAVADIENVSGRILGQDVALKSRTGNIVNRRDREDYAYSRKDLSFSTTHLGEAGLIESQNSLVLEAEGRIEVSGSELSGGQVSMQADTVEIKTQARSERYFAGDKKNHVTDSSTRHFASSIDGDDIVIFSVGGTRVDGSKIGATQSLRLTGGNIDINAVNDSEYFARLSTDDKTFGESVSSHRTFRSNSIASELNGATVVLVTEHGDIEITGSQINARAGLVMSSSDDIRIEAGHDDSMDESYRHESGWFSGGSVYSETEDLEGEIRQSAVSSRIDAESLVLDASGDIELTGVEIAVNDSLAATARDIAVRSTSDQKTTYSRHTEITVGVGDLASNPGDIDDLVEIEDGKLKLRLGGALYKNAESSTREVTAVASQIEASTIQFDAVRGGASDLTIEGSDLLATDSIELNATGEVALLDARHEYTREDLSQQGTAVVSLTARNEYEQVTRAVKAVRDAERDLRHARDDYDLYQDELDAQQAELRRLEQQYATGNGFIEREDINEFKRHLERMKDDREFYEANIALATVTLASKTTALIQQTGRAASSSATYGFNLALDLDIEAIERQVDEYYRQSRASNLSANRLSINAGDVAWLRGANLLAQDSIDIVAQDIDIFAASSTVGSKDREQQVSFGYSWSLMGDAFTADPRELGSNISGEGSERESDSRTYANAQLLAANIRLEAIGDTTIKGADIHAEEKLDIIAGNLDVASVQNLSSTESHSRGLSYSGSGTGANASEGYSESLETQVTRLTGREVDISVADHTDLEGAVIASVDAQGADNGRLTLTTETLRASSLNNTLDSEDRSLGLLAGQTSTLDYRDETGNTKTRALATLGHGNIRVDDTGLSDTRFLNTDITDTEVAIYDIESHQGLSGELDIRLLSEQGRTEIAEDWLKTRMIGNTLELMVTTERVGIEDFFNETGKTHNTYQAVKQQIAADPELAAMLQDPSLTPELKQRMLDQVTDAVMRQLGLSPHDNKIIATERTAPDGSRILGFYSEQTGNAYINDPENDSIRELVVTAGHEASHAIDYQGDIENSTFEDRRDNNLYAENFGENLASYADFALSANDYDAVALSNDHASNDSALTRSNVATFSTLDHEKGDFYCINSYSCYGDITEKAFISSQTISVPIKILTNYQIREKVAVDGSLVGFEAYNPESKNIVVMKAEELSGFVQIVESVPVIGSFIENMSIAEHISSNSISELYDDGYRQGVTNAWLNYLSDPDTYFEAAAGFVIGSSVSKVLRYSKAADNIDFGSARRAYLNERYGRTGDLNYDITLRGYLEKVDSLDVSTNPGQAVFYSGWNPAGVSNRKLAEAFSLNKGWTILEQTPGGKWLNQEKLYGSDRWATDLLAPVDADRVWTKLSQQYANGVQNSATAFVNGAKQNRVFYKYEYPILQKNKIDIDFRD